MPGPRAEHAAGMGAARGALTKWPAGSHHRPVGTSNLPSGTVTFLFTDMEGSTRLLHELGAE